MESLFLAQVFGIVIAAFALTGLARPQAIRDAMRDFDHESFARLVVGCIAIALGTVIVLTHNIWAWDYRGIITLIGWTALIKGVSYIVAPKQAVSLTKAMVKTPQHLKMFLFACLVVGGYLAYKGFGF
jgi:uncharacterized protein YjeT (DUF2065 family)